MGISSPDLRSNGENMANDDPKITHWPLIIGASIGLVFIVSMVAFTPLIVSHLIMITSDKHGQFGDMFGMTNAIFSGLAFLGVICAIILQSQELAAQREELKLSRRELKLTRQEMKRQGDNSSLQRFEITFFRLLEEFKQEKESLYYTQIGVPQE